MAWAKEQLKKFKQEYATGAVSVIYDPNKLIMNGIQNCYNGGYLFLQKIYNELSLGDICGQISKRYNFEFDLTEILSRLVLSRILYPASKLATLELSKKFFEHPKFELHDIYRALEIISKETDYIQSQMYLSSLKVSKRNTGILYFDCTNYFFEIEQEDGLKQYGHSKDHKPNPIVQMGLFMDGDGIPLAFSMFAGNENEQQHLLPLEKKILEDFKLARFVVCTDAGVSSLTNRKFNDKPGRGFVTTQSVKKLQTHLKEWCLCPQGWRISGMAREYDLTKDELSQDTVYYKERWINENGLSQKLVVTFSPKYRDYQRNIRACHVARAERAIAKNKVEATRPTDPKRLIKTVHVTPDGEVAEKATSYIDRPIVMEEEKYDGIYAVCTNLDESADEILRVTKQRWEIEECFRIMKSEFKARPVYLSRDDRIKAHFTTCFVALTIYRFLEKRLEKKFTCKQIIEGLREMNFTRVPKEGYIPAYTRSEFTNALHEKFGFRTDTEIMTQAALRKIVKMCSTN